MMDADHGLPFGCRSSMIRLGGLARSIARWSQAALRELFEETGVRAVGRTVSKGAQAVGEFAERAGRKIRELAS